MGKPILRKKEATFLGTIAPEDIKTHYTPYFKIEIHNFKPKTWLKNVQIEITYETIEEQ